MRHFAFLVCVTSVIYFVKKTSIVGLYKNFQREFDEKQLFEKLSNRRIFSIFVVAN